MVHGGTCIYFGELDAFCVASVVFIDIENDHNIHQTALMGVLVVPGSSARPVLSREVVSTYGPVSYTHLTLPTIA